MYSVNYSPIPTNSHEKAKSMKGETIEISPHERIIMDDQSKLMNFFYKPFWRTLYGEHAHRLKIEFHTI
jgi:hypothetical protein